MDLQSNDKTVLIIDDSDLDIYIAERVLKRTPGISKVLKVVTVGDAMDLIEASDLPVSDYVLLDINMPIMSGFALLQKILDRWGPDFVRYNVSVLTSSENATDRDTAGRFEIIGNYFRKPFDAQDAAEMLRAS